VLSRYFDNKGGGSGSDSGKVDCKSTDSIYCDWCQSESNPSGIDQYSGREEVDQEQTEQEGVVQVTE
jgi:hypothetical protein